LKPIIYNVLKKKLYVREVTIPTTLTTKYLRDFTQEHTLQTVMTVESEVTSTHNMFLVRHNASSTELSKLQGLACLAVTGVMKTTPTAAMEGGPTWISPLHVMTKVEVRQAPIDQ
jgi:hypothetical protein